MTTEPSETTWVSMLDLERYALGELSPERQAEIDALAAHDETLRTRLARVRQDIASAAHDLPAPRWEAMADNDPAASSSETSWWAWLARPPVWAGGLALALGGLLVLRPAPDDGVRFRGAFDLTLHRLRADTARRIDDTVQAVPADRIQYEILAAQPGVLSVFNLQDDGEFQVYEAPTEIDAGQSLKGAVALDDYVGTERIYFVFDPEPVTVQDFEDALPGDPPFDLDDWVTLPDLPGVQRSLLVIKEPSP